MDPVYHFVRTKERGYHTGIPARDLTREDVEALSAEQLATVEASPLYRKIERAEGKAPATRAAGGKS